MLNQILSVHKFVEWLSAARLPVGKMLPYRYLSATIPGAVTLGTSAGMARDLLTFVANFKPGMGDWIAFVLSNQDPQWKIRIAAVILEMELETMLMSVIVRRNDPARI